MQSRLARPVLVVTREAAAMRIVVAALVVGLVGAVGARAETLQIKPKFFDINPHDGFMDPGSSSNPYAIQDRAGHQVGTIRPRFYDLNPRDGFMDPGSWSNPYEVETDDDE